MDDFDEDQRQGEAYGDEIVALLHQVGQRLLRSEQDRKQLKDAMDDLAEKADQGERAFLTLQDRINKTESMIEKRQRAIERSQQEQMARLEKAAAMTDRIEAALAENAKINRRLDKLTQEKARTMRKLERIEAAVLETHDAISARALPPPPGAGKRKDEAFDDKDAAFKNWLPPAPAANDRDEDDEARPWYKQHGPVRAAAITGMVLIGLLGGWAVNSLQGNGFEREAASLSAPPPMQTAAQDAPAYNRFFEEDNVEAAAARGTPDKESFTRAIEQALSGSVPANEEDTASLTPNAPPAEDDILDMDDSELLAKFEQDPDALAAQLNEISPADAASMIDEVHDAAPVKATPAKPASVNPKEDIREMTSAEFLQGQKDSRPLRERIKPDSSLPELIREVEKKAYEGVPEAQHDLAAIYTAGHGGVKTDYARAALWFKESALNGVANARYNLGVLYHQGLGVKKDINTAVNWYRAAAEKGHPEAQYNLGIAYIEGIGARYNPDKAAHYFEKAANEGIMEAAYNLGLIHENGLSGKSRPDEALYWYKQASDLGSPEAKVAMDQLAKTLGLQPSEVERMYGNVKADKKAETKKSAPEAATKTAATPSAVNAPPPVPAQSSGMEYIEAQPLDAGPADAPATVATDAPIAMTEQPAPSAPPKSSAVTAADSATIAQIQEQLIRIGLYPGPADGVHDTLTADAIRAYQANYNLPADGRASQALLVHMMTSELGNNDEYGSRAQ